MTLRFVGDRAQLAVKHAPAYELYNKYKRSVPKIDQKKVYDCVETVVDSQEKFSVAAAFPEPWPNELVPIWKLCKDRTLAAFTLAHIIIDYLVNDNEMWLCAKTNIQLRVFESKFYWRDRY